MSYFIQGGGTFSPFAPTSHFMSEKGRNTRSVLACGKGGVGGKPPRVMFNLEPDRLDTKGLPNSKCWALSTA